MTRSAAHTSTSKASSHHSPPQPDTKQQAGLPGVFQLFTQATQVLGRNRKLFLGILAIYGLLNILLVHGLADSGNVQDIKATLDQAFDDKGGQVTSGLTILMYLLGGSGSTNTTTATASVYQTFILIISSLALIWALRQSFSRTAVRVRDAFYKGMYPLVPFILILLVVGLQLLPFVLGGLLYSIAIGDGIAVNLIEKIFWGILFLLASLLSLYLITPSVFALYIVTLPDMTPLKALRSARELVAGRRWLVLRKLVFLPLALFAVLVIIMLPIIIWLTPLAAFIYFVLTLGGLAVIHSYMYSLYRALLT